MEQDKILKDVFKDFSNNSAIMDTSIVSVNLFKKTNKIDISLKSNKKVEIADISTFEKYIKNKFDIDTIVIKIEYTFNIGEDVIKNEWSQIICYVAQKFPLTKAILKDCAPVFNDNKITINIGVKGKEILQVRNMDVALSDVIFNLYGKRYKIEYIEDVSEDAIQKMEEKLKKEEKKAIDSIKVTIPKEEPKPVVEEKKERKR